MNTFQQHPLKDVEDQISKRLGGGEYTAKAAVPTEPQTVVGNKAREPT